MLYSEIIAVCSLIHTKNINTPCGQNVPRSKHNNAYSLAVFSLSLFLSFLFQTAITIFCSLPTDAMYSRTFPGGQTAPLAVPPYALVYEHWKQQFDYGIHKIRQVKTLNHTNHTP
jgi:hypothetical protein